MITFAQKTYNLQSNDTILDETETQYVLRVRDLASDERPREKLAQFGPKNLNVAELVAIVLGVGSKKEEVLAMSARILKEYGEKTLTYETNPKHLAETLNIPFGKACQLIASFELGRRFFTSQAGRAVFVRNAKQAYEYLKPMASLKKRTATRLIFEQSP